MGQLFHYLIHYKGRLSFAAIASILNKIFDLMPPLLVGWVVATLSGQIPNWIQVLLPNHNIWTLAIFLAILSVLIFGLESVTQWLADRAFMMLAQDVQHDLRIATYEKIQAREIAFFENHRMGETLAMLNDDVNQLERFLNSGFSDLLQLATLMVFSCFVLFATSWQLALIGMAPIPLIIWGSLKFQHYIGPRYRLMRDSVGQLSSRLENNLSGIMVIKSFTAENFETARVTAASNQYRKTNYHAINLSTLFVPLIRMCVACGFAGVLLAGSFWILNNEHGINVAQLVMFSMLIQRLLWPLTRLGVTLDSYQRADASARRTFSLLATEAKIKDPATPVTLSKCRGTISFNHVQFQYGEYKPVLQDLNLHIAAGETIGIAGQTGAGKSTLIKLLLRLYDVTGGSICIDGHDIRQLSLYDLRRHIGLVSQDVYLFHGSIAENIAYGLADVSLNQIIQAAKLAHLHEFISTLPEGYATLVGERGIKLSGGQRQRLSIARAILKNAPILILDEATSSIDTETEKIIQENLKLITSGKTALIIAHRLSTIRDVDRIFVIGNGGLIEQGSHDALLNLNGVYADLWRVQSGEIEHKAPISVLN
ncbi:MAG TPA: ABC transporter ATP-binding protein [Gammaproteobacteria bacterium]|nr:ABC transporter ATP-binding protein [Gammaproteobacteria bacterium]